MWTSIQIEIVKILKKLFELDVLLYDLQSTLKIIKAAIKWRRIKCTRGEKCLEILDVILVKGTEGNKKCIFVQSLFDSSSTLHPLNLTSPLFTLSHTHYHTLSSLLHTQILSLSHTHSHTLSLSLFLYLSLSFLSFKYISTLTHIHSHTFALSHTYTHVWM